MAPLLLKSFVFPISVDNFLKLFWYDNIWLEQFMIHKLKDLQVEIDSWKKVNDQHEVFQRTIRSFHPSKISFPGLPSHAESIKTQTLEKNYQDSNSIIKIVEINNLRGIPYSDYFSVCIEWSINEIPSQTSSPECQVSIYLYFLFHKSTWLQGTIESNTKSEMMEIYELWGESVNSHLCSRLDLQTTPIDLLSCHSPKPSQVEFKAQVIISHVGSEEAQEEDEEEDEDIFYDCEADENRFLNSFHSLTNMNSQAVYLEEKSSYHHGNKTFSNQQRIMTSHDMAVSIVETVFVLAEFWFWKIYQFYCYDLKDLFNIDPSQVMNRIINSFIPSWHSPLLSHPDIYGPLIAVFCLPQTLLLAMETSKHGCNPTSQLGNTVVVSLTIWLGLSFLYRIVSYIVAPTIQFKHCLSVVGYSFFSWNLAILCYLPLEKYKNHIDIPSLLPLVLIGIPASIAQGYMFWEYTPSSTIRLQPAALPPRLQQCATNNYRCIQNFLWALPKIIVFILVAGTHYQFLWYIARVFLPGRRQLCQLSALMKPSKYADILSQKDLRQFALKVLSGKLDE